MLYIYIFKFQIVTFLTFLTISQLLYRVFLCFYNIILYPLFYIVTSFSLRVIICKTLKKKGRAFRNIGFKYTQFSTVKSALLLFRYPFHIPTERLLLSSREGGGGGVYSRFQVTQMIEWGQKSKPKKIPMASNKPKNSLDQKLTLKNPMLNFLALKISRKG